MPAIAACNIDLLRFARQPGLRRLFSEEAGAVLQVARDDLAALEARAQELGLGDCLHRLGEAVAGDDGGHR